MTQDEINRLITKLYRGWIESIQHRQFDWFERHLAEDYTCTAHPFGNFFLRKREFIEADKKVQAIKVEFVEVVARRVGSVILSNLVIKVNEEKHAADLGEGLPTAAELSATVTGRTIAYASAWRGNGDLWQCFDHHMVGPVD